MAHQEEFGADRRSSAGGHNPPRLTRTMSSRKLQALDFIKRYFAQWGHSPTLGELSAELGVSAKRAHDLVHALAEQQMIRHTAGKTRGIELIDRAAGLSEADVLLHLAAMGWTVAHGGFVLHAPGAPPGGVFPVQQLTEKGLHALPMLDHVDVSAEASGVGTSGRQNEGPAAA